MPADEGLTARTTPADTPPPPLEGPGLGLNAFLSPRRRLIAQGTATRIHLPAPWIDHLHLVGETLSRITTVDEVGGPGCGPVALGALPFDRTTTASLVVPAALWGVGPEGTRWFTTVAGGHDDPHAVATEALPQPPDPAAGYSVRATLDPDEWCERVAEATRRIRGGRLDKVVLARELLVTGPGEWARGELLGRLAAAHPAAYTFLVDGFLGASPELLVSRIGETVRAQPMAGTTPRSGDPDRDQRAAAALAADPKNTHEHRITIDMVHNTLLPWCSYLDIEPTPAVVAAGAVQHLATLVEGRLSRPTPSVLDLVAELHPTPAVGGSPRAEALGLIAELEPGARGRYAGPTGWVDAAGNGAFCVSVRSATLEGNRARMWAGVGVVADSDPAAELAETRAKAQALLGALIRP